MTGFNVRKQMPGVALSRDEFRKRYCDHFSDPVFAPLRAEIDRIVDAAWDAYSNARKAPHTRRAGAGFADPDYELSVDWLAAREKIKDLERQQKDPASPSRILLVNGASRSEHTCPGESSKSWRLVMIARELLAHEPQLEVEVLDLSRLGSEYGRVIYPCKTCVSTAMPLCHWPCSCYPNHALGQVQDWMNDIYAMWAAAHGVMIVCPVNWYGPPSGLKLMIDRLVCADGGNPDPTSTHGKKVDEAKAMEMAGWPYPQHLAGRVFSVVVHGDYAGAEMVHDAIASWLRDSGLMEAGHLSQLSRMIGYMESYATSHDDLDRDTAVQEEVRNAARALVEAVKLSRSGAMRQPDSALSEPRKK
ncbi:MAG: NAD(P)H-dependent oxidoreductase [Xanthobacteraceae bacterium]|nr:NAD(P)H-dependent oxidoreductase [Xanthobacteraceae bacterium]